MKNKSIFKVLCSTVLVTAMTASTVMATPPTQAEINQYFGGAQESTGSLEYRDVSINSADISSLRTATYELYSKAKEEKVAIEKALNKVFGKTALQDGVSGNGLSEEGRTPYNVLADNTAGITQVLNDIIDNNILADSGEKNKPGSNIYEAARNLYQTGFAAGEKDGGSSIDHISATTYTKYRIGESGEEERMIYRKGMSVIMQDRDLLYASYEDDEGKEHLYTGARQLYVCVKGNKNVGTADEYLEATGDFYQEYKAGYWKAASINFTTNEENAELDHMIASAGTDIRNYKELDILDIALLIKKARDIESFDIRSLGWPIGSEILVKNENGVKTYAVIIGYYTDYYANDELLSQANCYAGEYALDSGLNDEFYKWTIGGCATVPNTNEKSGIIGGGADVRYCGLRAPITFEIKEVRVSNSWNRDQNEKWKSSETRKTLNSDAFISANYTKIAPYIQPVVKTTYDVNENIKTYSADRVFLLSEAEIFADQDTIANSNGSYYYSGDSDFHIDQRYEYYKKKGPVYFHTEADEIWLRSPANTEKNMKGTWCTFKKNGSKPNESTSETRHVIDSYNLGQPVYTHIGIAGAFCL